MQFGRLFAAAPMYGKQWLRIGAVSALLGLLSCSIAPRMASVAPQGTDLNGVWILDRRNSDDVRARLAPLIEKQERRWRTLERRAMDDGNTGFLDADSAQPPGSDQSTMQWMRQQRQQEAEALIAFVAPPTQLDIRISTRDGQQEISVKTDKGEGTRVLVPGQSSSLFMERGAFKVNSGWQGAAFVVDLDGSGENSMQVVQYYTISDAGTRLDLRMETRLPELGKQAFRFSYKRSGSP